MAQMKDIDRDKVLALTLVRDTPELVDTMLTQLPDVKIVDNGSKTPVAKAWLRLPENKYFSGGWNMAAAKAYNECYEWVWLLNSDVSGFPNNCLDRLLCVAETFQAVMLSPAIKGYQYSSMKPEGDPMTLYIDCVAPLINLEWFFDNAGFDEKLLGHGADLDLCYRTQDDIKIVARNLVINHEWCATANKLGDFAMYEDKWVDEYLRYKHGKRIVEFCQRFYPK